MFSYTRAEGLNVSTPLSETKRNALEILEIQIHYPLYMSANSLDPAIPRISQQSFWSIQPYLLFTEYIICIRHEK